MARAAALSPRAARAPQRRIRPGPLAVFFVGLLLATSLGQLATSRLASVPVTAVRTARSAPLGLDNVTDDWPDTTLARLLAEAGVDGLDPSLPATSALLGRSAPASVLVEEYALALAQSATPLRDAIAAWLATTRLPEDPVRLHDELRRADALPVDLQRTLGIVLMALTDASRLQDEALGAMRASDASWLLGAVAALRPGELPPEDEAGAWAAERQRFRNLLDGIELGKILEAARLVLAAHAKTSDALKHHAALATQREPLRQEIADRFLGFYRQHTPAVIAQSSVAQRIGIVTDYVRLISGSAPPAPVRATAPPTLAEALRDYAAALGADAPKITVLGSQPAALPPALQDALARLVQAQAGLLRGDPRDVSDPLAPTLRFLATLADVYPTLEAFHYVYRLMAPTVQLRPGAEAETLRDLAPILGLLGNASTTLPQSIRLAGYLSTGRVNSIGFEPDLSPGALGRALDAAGHEAPSGEGWAAATGLLPRPVERAAARIFQAQEAARSHVDSVRASLSPQQQAGLEAGLPSVLQLRQGRISDAGLQSVRIEVEGALAVREALLAATELIAEAIEESRDELRPYVPVTMSRSSSVEAPDSPEGDGDEEAGGDDGSEAPFGSMSMSASSSVPVSCQPTVPSSQCSRDILLTGPVVITGPLGFPYFSTNVGGYEHLLWIDLGGDDTYFTRPAVSRGAPSVFLEMGGHDTYSVGDGDGTAPRQAAAMASGAIAILIDEEGDDVYEATSGLAQAATLGIGVAVLVDEAGDDRRRITGGQGQAITIAASGGSALALLIDREALDGLGNDDYVIASAGQARGQAATSSSSTDPTHAFAGTAILVDQQGNDVYGGGNQARVLGGGATGPFLPANGLAILADLAGRDDYARRSSDGPNRENRQCATNLDANPSVQPDSPPFVNAASPSVQPGIPGTTSANSFIKGTQLSQIGVTGDLVSLFLDLEGGVCNPRSPAGTLPLDDVGDLDPTRLDEEIAELIASLLSSDAIADRDQDGWTDDSENTTAGDWQDPGRYPAGLPARPALWPEGQPYPPVQAPRAVPIGSDYLVEYGDIFALGDVAGSVQTRNHRFSIDLGGSDEYRNLVGAYQSASVHLDVGNESDLYAGGARSQGVDGLLIDAGGHDVYLAGAESQGSSTDRPDFLGHRKSYLSLLADLGGDDRYVAGDRSQGYAEIGAATNAPTRLVPTRMGLLLDAAGDDEYISPRQGSASGLHPTPTQAGDAGATHLIGAFNDLGGTDRYVAELQAGSTVALPAPILELSAANVVWGHFADTEGYDSYYVPHLGFDASGDRNGRYDVTTNLSAVTFLPGNFGGQNSWVSGRSFIDIDPGFRINESWREDPVENRDDFEVWLPGAGIAIGKAGPTVYRNVYAFSADLGGGDTYLNNAGASVFSPLWLDDPAGLRQAYVPPLQVPRYYIAPTASGWSNPPRTLASILLDPVGADEYTDREWTASESGFVANEGTPNLAISPQRVNPFSTAPTTEYPNLVVGILPQHRFQNLSAIRRPEAVRHMLSQGVGILGVGLLIDGEGNDRYTGQFFSQGVAVSGFGLLWDREGEDVYGYDGALVRAPVGSGSQIAWLDAREGRRDIRTRGAGAPALVTSPPDPRFGWPAENGEPTLDGTRLVWARRLLANWSLVTATVPGNPITPVPLVDSVFNETQPFLSGNSLVYVSDRTGVPTVQYIQDITILASQFKPAIIHAGNRPQSEPTLKASASSIQIGWSEQNETGRWSVWVRDLLAGTPAQRVPTGTGDQRRPRVDGGWVVWQEWDPATQSWDAWAADMRFAPTVRVPLGTGLGDQEWPDVASTGFLWADRADGSLRFRPRGTTFGQCTSLPASPARFGSPSFDRSDESLIYAVREGNAANSRSLLHELVRWSLATCSVMTLLTSSQGEGPRFHQGAAIQRGLGLVVEEGGNDVYDGLEFAQGSTFTFETDPQRLEQGNNNRPEWILDPGNRQGHPMEEANKGILLDLDGSDQYTARFYSQASHGTGIFMHKLGQSEYPKPLPSHAQLAQLGDDTPYVATVFASDQQALLLDFRGDDVYSAEAKSQGYAGGVYGASALLGQVTSDGPQVTDADPAPFLINSAALLLDGQGKDRYRYKPVQNIAADLANSFDPGHPCENAPEKIQPSEPRQVPDLGITPREDCYGAIPPEGAAAIDQVRALPESLISSLASGPTQNPMTGEDRDNGIWRQHSMEPEPLASSFMTAGPEWFVGPVERKVDNAPTYSILVHPGGLGVDRGFLETYDSVFSNQARSLFEITPEADQSATTGPAPVLVSGIVRLSLEVKRNQSEAPADVRSVEYFLAHQGTETRLSTVRSAACPEGDFCFDWNSPSASLGDGVYRIRARANIGSSATGMSLGHIDRTGSILLDNVPRLKVDVLPDGSIGVRPPVFSPLSWNPASPSQTEFGFRVSKHTDGGPGFVTTEILRVGSPNPIGIITGSFNASADGAEQVWRGAWNGRLPDGQSAGTGDFELRVRATDRPAGDPQAAPRAVELRIPFRIDDAQPGLTCAFPAKVPAFTCNGTGFISEAAASAKTGSLVTVPFSWSPGPPRVPAEIARYHVFYCRTSCSSLTAWQYTTTPGDKPELTLTALASGNRVQLGVLAEDKYGNLEGGILADGSRASDARAAFLARYNARAFLDVRIDLFLPTLTTRLTLNGAQVVNPSISPNSNLVIGGTASDANQVSVEVFLLHPDGDTFSVPVSPVAGPPAGSFTTPPFHALPIAHTWTGGVLVYLVIASDAGGNRVTKQGFLLLDTDVPRLLPSTTTVYPEGRNFVEAGDVLRPQIAVSDSPNFPNTVGSATNALVVHLNVSQLTPDLGTIHVSKFRRTASREYFTFEVPVNTTPSASQVIDLPITVTDQAGNVRWGNLSVVHGKPVFGISAATVNETTHERVVLRWRTERASLGSVQYGEAGKFDRTADSNEPAPSFEHEAVLIPLSGRTAYTYRLVARDAGLEEIGMPGVVTTASGLGLTLLEPTAPGFSASGPFPVRWAAELLADPAEQLFYRIRARPVGTSTFFVMGQFEGPQGEQSFPFDPLEFTDGRYEIQVEATSRGETASQRSAPILLDRRRPLGIVESPLSGSTTNESRPLIAIRFTDALSGVDAASLRIYLDEGPQPLPIAAPPLADGRLAIVPEVPLPPGAHTLRALASDRAGNLATISWRFTVDATAPTILSHELTGGSSPTRLRPGDTLRLSVRLADESQIRRVWAETENATSVPALELDRKSDNRFETPIVLDRATLAGRTDSYLVRVLAEDQYGHRTPQAHLVPLLVDGESPRLDNLTATATLERLSLRITATEPVRWSLLATPGTLETPLGNVPQTVLEARFALPSPPSERIQLAVRMIDAAGHETRLERSFLTPVASDANPPAAPSELHASVSPQGRVFLYWARAEDDLGVREYRIFRSLDGDAFHRVASTPDTKLFDAPPPARAASYFVVAVDLAGHASLPSPAVLVESVAAPSLTNVMVRPTRGTPSTEFLFQATLLSPTGAAPEWIHLVFDGEPIAMKRTPTGDCRTGCLYEHRTRLSAMDARAKPSLFHVEATVNGSLVRAPAAEVAGPVVLADPPHSASREGVLQARIPSPGLSLALLEIVAVALVYRIRRKDE